MVSFAMQMRELLPVWVLWVGFAGFALAGEASDAPDESATPEPPPAAEQPSGQAEDPEAEAPEAEAPEVEDIETILTQPLGQEEYVEAERCLSRFDYHSVDIIDNQHVLFRGRRGKGWLNVLRSPCVGLRRHDIPRFEFRASSQLCSLDTFVGLDSNFSGFSRSSAQCALGDFQPVTEEQVALIKATAESRRGNRARRKKDPGDSVEEQPD